MLFLVSAVKQNKPFVSRNKISHLYQETKYRETEFMCFRDDLKHHSPIYIFFLPRVPWMCCNVVFSLRIVNITTWKILIPRLTTLYQQSISYLV